METRTTLSHPNVTVAPSPAVRTPQVFVGALSSWGSMATYGAFHGGKGNALSALMERVFYHAVDRGFAQPTVPSVEVVFGTLKRTFEALKQSCRLSAPVWILDFPGLYYSGPKKQLYERAAETVHRRGFLPRDAHLKSFVKVEKIEIKPKRQVARLIQPRSPEYNVLVGRYIKHLEHPTYLQLNELWGGPTVMKGLNCFQQAHVMREAWDSFAQPVAIMLDAVRFDQHVSIPMLQWEHSIYLEHYRGDDRNALATLLRHQLHNVGRIRLENETIRYRVDGCRMSGDMNTALGNCLLMCSCCWALVQEVGVRARLFNNGDDCCLIVESRHLEVLRSAIKPFFLRLGFIIDIEGSTRVFEEISFCQTQPVFDGRLWRMVRDPRKVLSKDTTLLRRWSPKEWDAYFACLGKCGLALTWGLPIFQEFYLAMERFQVGELSERLAAHVSGKISRSGMWQLANGLDRRVRPITDAARASFAIAFDIPPVVQRQYENVFQRAPRVSSSLFEDARRTLYL